MSATSVPTKNARGFWTPWLTIAAVALVAVIAGVLLPQMLPGDMVVEKQRSIGEVKGKSKTEYVPPTVPEMPNPQGMLARLAGGTVLVLGLSVASIWVMRRWVLSQQAGQSAGQTLRLMESLALGNRCAVHLVNLGNREVLVGVDGGGIKTIVPLPKVFEEVLSDTDAPLPLSAN